MARAIPEGYSTVTPYLTVKDSAKVIEFYKKAFGAEEKVRMPGPGGKIMHAEIKIGTSMMMMADESPEMSAPLSKSSFMIYCENTDTTFKRAIDAGCTSIMEPADMFWGDRFAKLKDPFGQEWSIATHQKDMTPAEMKKAQDDFMAQMAKNKP